MFLFIILIVIVFLAFSLQNSGLKETLTITTKSPSKSKCKCIGCPCEDCKGGHFFRKKAFPKNIKKVCADCRCRDCKCRQWNQAYPVLDGEKCFTSCPYPLEGPYDFITGNKGECCVKGGGATFNVGA